MDIVTQLQSLLLGLIYFNQLCVPLSTDYLTNVLDDLGLQSSETLRNIDVLLKATPDTFTEAAEQMPQRVGHAISSMRSIDL